MAKERESEAIWRERLARWQSSGEDAETFAAREGVTAKSLRWWASTTRRRDARAASSSPAQSFLPVTIGAGRYSATTTATMATIEVELISGHLLRIARGFDVETLQRVVDAIGGHR